MRCDLIGRGFGQGVVSTYGYLSGLPVGCTLEVDQAALTAVYGRRSSWHSVRPMEQA